MSAAERLTDVITYHGEGPVWDERAGRLRLVDMLAGDLVEVDVETGTEAAREHVGWVAAAWRPRRDGGMVVAVERGFVLVDADGAREALPEIWSDPGVRLNEGACDPAGSFYCGSMAYSQEPGAGTLYRLDPDRTVRPVLHEVTVSNGLAWSPGGRTAYYNDTPTHRITRLVPDAGDLLRVEPFVEVDGNPDGLTVDAEGGVWIALYGGSAVHRYAPDGSLDAVVSVGAEQVTACTFGGPGLDRLFITTSRENLEPGNDPAAGSVFVVEPGVQGLAPLPFAG